VKGEGLLNAKDERRGKDRLRIFRLIHPTFTSLPLDAFIHSRSQRLLSGVEGYGAVRRFSLSLSLNTSTPNPHPTSVRAPSTSAASSCVCVCV